MSYEDVTQSYFVLWVLETTVIVDMGVMKNSERIDRFKASSVLLLGLCWPLLLLVFVLDAIVWVIGMPINTAANSRWANNIDRYFCASRPKMSFRPDRRLVIQALGSNKLFWVADGGRPTNRATSCEGYVIEHLATDDAALSLSGP